MEQTDARPAIERADATAILSVLLILLGVVLIRNAWIAEDAYIMFRTIDNFQHGWGLTWNPTERVQAYTCPLWMFVLSGVSLITSEFYYSTIAFSIVITLGIAYLLAFKIANSPWAGIAGLTALLFSRGFIDYSTSGLENAMTHLILVWFCLVFFTREASPRSHFWLCLIACCGMLNRMDTVLFYLPALIYTYWQIPKWKGMQLTALGFLPFFLWEAFSLFYYGMLIPNTAYAKLNVGISKTEMMWQGIYYYLHGFSKDPLTMLVIACGLVLAWMTKSAKHRLLVIGIDLYLLYICKIGGDYMSMRFFTGPFIVAVVLLLRNAQLSRPQPALGLIAVLLLLGLTTPHNPIVNNDDYGTNDYAQEVDNKGIADERGFYYPHLGLLRAHRGRFVPDLYNRIRPNSKRRGVYVSGNVGQWVFAMHPTAHVIDQAALADSLLSRLPAASVKNWRVGHYLRNLPEGYEESVRSGKNMLADPNLARFYDRMKLIVSGDLFSRERMVAIWQLNTGQLDHLIDFRHYKKHTGPPGQTEIAEEPAKNRE
jgi:arabinofuranosyltransferase